MMWKGVGTMREERNVLNSDVEIPEVVLKKSG